MLWIVKQSNRTVFSRVEFLSSYPLHTSGSKQIMAKLNLFDMRSGVESLQMTFVHQDVSIPRSAIFHVDDGLVGVFHWALLNHWTDVLVRSQLEHLSNLRRGSDYRAS